MKRPWVHTASGKVLHVTECAQAAEPILLWLSSSDCQLSCGWQSAQLQVILITGLADGKRRH